MTSLFISFICALNISYVNSCQDILSLNFSIKLISIRKKYLEIIPFQPHLSIKASINSSFKGTPLLLLRDDQSHLSLNFSISSSDHGNFWFLLRDDQSHLSLNFSISSSDHGKYRFELKSFQFRQSLSSLVITLIFLPIANFSCWAGLTEPIHINFFFSFAVSFTIK